MLCKECPQITCKIFANEIPVRDTTPLTVFLDYHAINGARGQRRQQIHRRVDGDGHVRKDSGFVVFLKDSNNGIDHTSTASGDFRNEDNGIDQDQVEKQKRQKKSATLPKTQLRSASADLDSELRGKTLRAYLFMMKNAKPVGVRELQRGLDLSSPSVAYHHLEKLERLGLVEKDEYSEYRLVKNVDVRVLQAFAQVGRLLVPRFIFYAMFFTTLLVGYFLIYLGNSNIFALSFGISASAFSWYETVRTWMKRPF